MVVEDHQPDADFLEAVLDRISEANYVITHVIRLEEGLIHLGKGTTDIVMLDLNLPDSSGAATAEQVIAQFSRVPVLIVSSMTDLELAALAVQLGAQDFLVKDRLERMSHVEGLVEETVERAIRYAVERGRTQYAMRMVRERELQTLKGLLPFCPGCNKIRDTTTNTWHKPDDYLEAHADIEATHGICPDCLLDQVLEIIGEDDKLSPEARQRAAEFLRGER